MYHSGIGGGGFAMVRDAEGNYEAIDFRESAPAAAYEDMYQGNVPGSILGGLSAGVPSEVRGLGYIHEKYGVRITDMGHSLSSTMLTWNLPVPTMEDCDEWSYPCGSSRFQRSVKVTRPYTVHAPNIGYLVSADFIRYCHAAMNMTESNFLVEDPVWAIDFAPNGAWHRQLPCNVGVMG
jgi:gamma-glutamyltranspeptidase / glutathione hydrolase